MGGVLLKLQDKFRVGEKISLPGSKDEAYVEDVYLLTTKFRKDDDSHVSVPNAVFIQGEVVNWSRTPYRLFRTSIDVKEKNLGQPASFLQFINRCGVIMSSLCSFSATSADYQ